MTQGKPSLRNKVLAAADQLACEIGPAKLTLDAVAERAGVSKGGLLYHFPSKSALMQALVDGFIGKLQADIEARRARGEAMLVAYLGEQRHLRRSGPPPAGVVAAMVEDPHFVTPVRAFEARVLSEIRAEASDPELASSIYLAIQGIRCLDLLGMQNLTDAEVEAFFDNLERRARAL